MVVPTKVKSSAEMRETMRKKELALEVIERLKKEYPDAACSLERHK